MKKLKMMKKKRKTSSEFQLPDEIIHRIQSFMDDKTSARTAILSKPWHRAWLTRPDLSFDDGKLQASFPKYAEKTMQRYEHLNLKIESLRLHVTGTHHHRLAVKLLSKAIKDLGASDLDINFNNQFLGLTYKVLESETLARLSLNGLALEVCHKSEKEVTYSKLKSLNLSRVTAHGDLCKDLISRCPSIEELKLNNIKGLNLDLESVNWSKIKTLFLSRVNVEGRLSRVLISRCPSIEALTLYKIKNSSKVKRTFYYSKFAMDGLKFHKLKYLYLGRLDMGDTLRRRGFWAKFPHLKELVIVSDKYENYKRVRIRSQSLERLTMGLLTDQIMKAEFDVPNIRKFVFKGTRLPVIKFERTSARGEWESDIRVKCSRPRHIGSNFLSSLNRLVKTFSLSKLSLYINVKTPLTKTDGYVGDGSPKPRVEKLRLKGYASTRDFLGDLFSICRPELVIEDEPSRSKTINEFLLDLVCRRLVEEVRLSCGRKYTCFQIRWGLEPSTL